MGEVHEIAALGFGAQAAAYDQARPSYPPDAVAWLTESLGIGPGRHVVDLAAGTGKLTELLAGSGAMLIAIEPVSAMATRLRARLPSVPLLGGVAEAIPLGAASAEAVVVGQAFHWFDGPRAFAELARVVRPGGHLGLIWNAREHGVDWVDRIWSVMDRVEHSAPWRQPRADGDASAGRERYLAGHAENGWSGWTEASFHHVHYSSHEQVIDRMRSVSHVAALPDRRQREVLDEIRTILREHPQTRDSDLVGIPYRADAMVTERLEARRGESLPDPGSSMTGDGVR